MVSSSPLSKFTRDSRPAAGAIVWEGRTITSLLVILPSLHKNHNFQCLPSPSWHQLVPTSSQMPVREHVKARLAESPVIPGLGGGQTGLDRLAWTDRVSWMVVAGQPSVISPVHLHQRESQYPGNGNGTWKWEWEWWCGLCIAIWVHNEDGSLQNTTPVF